MWLVSDLVTWSLALLCLVEMMGIPCSIHFVKTARIALAILPMGSHPIFFYFVVLSYLGGDDGIRTHDPLLAGQVLSQLSYTPKLNAECIVHNAEWVLLLLFSGLGNGFIRSPVLCQH